SNAPPSPPAATHTGTMSRGAGGGGSFSAPAESFGRTDPSGTSQVSAATGSMTPWPTWLSTPRAGALAVRVNRLMIWGDVSCGYFARTRAATPETIAVEKLVPDGTSKVLSGPSIALTRLSSRGESPTTSVPGAAIDTHG